MFAVGIFARRPNTGFDVGDCNNPSTHRLLRVPAVVAAAAAAAAAVTSASATAAAKHLLNCLNTINRASLSYNGRRSSDADVCVAV